MGADLAGLWWAFILLGFFAGILSGSLGIGAGILIVPGLVIFFNCPQKSAQGTALCVMIFMALLGAYRYYKIPEIPIDFKVVGLLVLGSLGGVFLGTIIAHKLNSDTLRKILALYMLIAAIKLFMMPKQPTKLHRLDNRPAAEMRVQTHTGNEMRGTNDSNGND